MEKEKLKDKQPENLPDVSEFLLEEYRLAANELSEKKRYLEQRAGFLFAFSVVMVSTLVSVLLNKNDANIYVFIAGMVVSLIEIVFLSIVIMPRAYKTVDVVKMNCEAGPAVLFDTDRAYENLNNIIESYVKVVGRNRVLNKQKTIIFSLALLFQLFQCVMIMLLCLIGG